MKKQPRSPQEKKSLSYARDRRGDGSGENNKGVRKTLPRRERIAQRTYRRAVRRELPKNVTSASEDVAVEAEGRVRGIRRKQWRKWGNHSLAEWLHEQQDRREARTGRRAR